MTWSAGSWSMWPRRNAAAVPEPRPADGVAELLRRVRHIELRTRGLVNSRFAGEYHSVFKGQGIEFAEVREYLPGDEVRSIDWNVTARLGRPFVKRFVEEREITVLLLADVSGSARWGTRGRLKTELMAETAAALALSAARNNDRVGLLTVSDRVESFVPPRKGRRHVLRLVRDLVATRPAGQGTDLALGVLRAARLLRARSVIFLFSDFQLGTGWDALEPALARAAARHDVIAVQLEDPADGDLPGLGLLAVRDPETGERVVLDSSSPKARAGYREGAEAEAERAIRVFRRLGIDQVRLRTDQPYAHALLAFFRRRERRLRR